MEPGETVVERLIRDLGAILPSNKIHSDIKIDLGGIGVWACLTACIVMLAAAMIGATFITREFVRYDQQLQELREKDDIHDAWVQTLNNNKEDRSK